MSRDMSEMNDLENAREMLEEAIEDRGRHEDGTLYQEAEPNVWIK